MASPQRVEVYELPALEVVEQQQPQDELAARREQKARKLAGQAAVEAADPWGYYAIYSEAMQQGGVAIHEDIVGPDVDEPGVRPHYGLSSPYYLG